MSSIAVVGCAYWGKNVVRNFWDLNALHALYDIDERRLKELQSLSARSRCGLKFRKDRGVITPL